ncbi:MAG: hypothetical protein KF864_09885 [Phycisphaeraceae bacterium]|nr:hypothetical protein [Phycisphaeraceae bacterium]MBX3408585.1 hypothetical protein [Phycisphaeraceae bacterium]
MQGAKPWQIAVIGAAVLAVVGVSVYSCSNSRDLGLAKEIPMVDVVTGDRFVVKVPKSGSMGIPSKHPETGNETLIPLYQDENGNWRVSERYASSVNLKALGVESSALDRASGQVRVSDKPIKTIVGE